MRLADDQAQRRMMLRRLTDQEMVLNVVCEAPDPQNLLAQTQAVHPNLVLLDCKAQICCWHYCLGYPVKRVA